MEEDVYVHVKVIRQDAGAALVEWVDEGCLHRATIPANAIFESDVSAETLEMGIPFGVPWETLIEVSVTPEIIANELRKRGIWTAEDLNRESQRAILALQTAYRVDLGHLRKAMKEAQNE